MHDPETLVCSINLPSFKNSYYPNGKIFVPWWRNGGTILQIWHKDPCTDGSDDSCGYSCPKISTEDREKIKKIAISEFKSYHSQKIFDNFPPMAIAFTILHSINWQVFGNEKDFKQAFQVAFELTSNPHDNVRNCFTVDAKEDDFIRGVIALIRYQMLMERPWWKHPKFHVHHWKINFSILRTRIWNKLFDKCYVCNKRFKNDEGKCSDIGGWDCRYYRTGIFGRTIGVRHLNCNPTPEQTEKERELYYKKG